MSEPYQLVPVDFHGDELLAVQDERGVWVPLRRVCEALGIDADSQRKKLVGKAWAVTALNAATGPDGKSYESFCIHIDSLPMWLATIETSRVSAGIREKLERYQVECAAVLRDHFARKVTRDRLTERLDEFLLERASPHRVTWKDKLVLAVSRLYGHKFTGGRHPRFMAGIQSRIYRIVWGDDVYEEQKRRNPSPSFGSNHHQFAKHPDLLDQDLEIAHVLAVTSVTVEEFWARLEWHFKRTPMQVGFQLPKRSKT